MPGAAVLRARRYNHADQRGDRQPRRHLHDPAHPAVLALADILHSILVLGPPESPKHSLTRLPRVTAALVQIVNVIPNTCSHETLTFCSADYTPAKSPQTFAPWKIWSCNKNF
ncbi:hypothetical protein ACJJTC_006252 [Scirpophaga incertulas]